jgi:hypothetical protein
MPVLWNKTEAGPWAPCELALARHAVWKETGRIMAMAKGARPRGADVLLMPSDHDAMHWVLLSPMASEVSINGWRMQSGIRALRDRDEIRLGAARFFYSSERLAHVEPLPPMDRPVMCARCKQVIATGTPAVQCPQFGIWTHQSAEYECWTYAPTCPLCSQVTALDAGYAWTPEQLGA